MKNKIKNPEYFPILIDLAWYPCLVIGAGDVALRKVISLLEFNADVTVLAPKICDELKELKHKNKIKIINVNYSPEYLKNYKIIFSATNDQEVNRKIHEDCRKIAKLLNVVDNPPLCDFILPANVKRGNLTISIGSQGIAPFYVKEIKSKLDNLFPSYYNDIIELAGEFRHHIMDDERFDSTEIKKRAFTAFIEKDWEKIINKEGLEKAYQYMKDILNKFC